MFSFPWFAGFTSGMLALVAKCFMMLVVKIGEKENYSFFFTYVIFASLLLFIFGELYTLNLGLKYFDTSYIIPIFKASIVFHNTMCGGVLLQEFFVYKPLHISMYAVGILICIIGILVMLISKVEKKSDPKVKEVDDVDEPLISNKQISSINDDVC